MFSALMYCRKPTVPLERDKCLLTELARGMARYLQELNSLLLRTSLRVVK